MKAAEPRVERKKKMTHKAKTYLSFDAFVQDKVDQANEHLSKLDQDKLYQLLGLKK